MRTFKTRPFTRFAVKAGITDVALCRSVEEAERGLIAANLGGGLIKQRVARAGQGKSGGFRIMLVLKTGDRVIFVYGFAKNEKDNISMDELAALKKLAQELLAYNDAALSRATACGVLVEVNCGEKTIS